MIPRKQSLVHQVASILRNGIREGLWTDWLPGERALCGAYRVSRNTLRAALNRLESEGVLTAVHGKGTRITGTPQQVEREPNREAVVGFISSRAIEQVRPTTAIWIDELRERLFEAGLLLRIYHGSQYFRRDPGPALESLHKHHSPSCWILPNSTRPMQEWFEERRIPCVIAGSTYEGIALPSVDIDYRALCRHAAGIMLSRGHRRVCMLNPETTNPGDLEGEAGFQEGLELSHQPDIIAPVLRHGNALQEICLTIDHIFKAPQPPTAILVAKSYIIPDPGQPGRATGTQSSGRCFPCLPGRRSVSAVPDSRPDLLQHQSRNVYYKASSGRCWCH